MPKIICIIRTTNNIDDKILYCLSVVNIPIKIEKNIVKANNLCAQRKGNEF